jgi:anaerobic magnesium-protoporphyrin IX monomethyl ester cyclase
MRIALVHAPLRSMISDRALGYQTPLGLLMLAGPLLDHGFQVDLIDAARDRLTDAQVVGQLEPLQPDAVLVGHSASTKAHPASLRLLRAVKDALPQTLTVYGGVHPTFHFQEILAEPSAIDIIVRGEGEATMLGLAQALSNTRDAAPDSAGPAGGRAADGVGQSALRETDLSHVAGIAWRRNGRVMVNAPRPPLENLDSQRIAWELISDWDKYQAFGIGRTAVVQFSRGCPHRCTYCGQWPFWQRWGHRDVKPFVDELEFLHREQGVRFFWFADENPTTDKSVWQALLEEIARRGMPTRMTASIRAQDIVRDADILHLYRRAGFLYVLMGVETVTDQTLSRIGKASSVDDAYRAVRLLRRHRILSIIDYILGLDEETPRSIWRAFSGLHRYDSDFINMLYVTPYSWTAMGREMQGHGIVDEDLSHWDCRHAVVAQRKLTPAQMFLGAKLVEGIYHLHPQRLWRAATAADYDLRRHFRFAYGHVVGVFCSEIAEFLRPGWRVKERRRLPRPAAQSRVL